MTIGRFLARIQGHWLVSGGALLGLAAIAFIWVALISGLHYAEQTALRNAKNHTANLARAFEEQIIREIKAVDQSLMFVRDSFARDPDGFDVAQWAKSAAAVTDHAIQLTITNAHGIMVANSSAGGNTRLDLSDREHIRVQISSDKDELFISKPLIGRVSHQWSIQFTRKLFDANGNFAGVAVVSLDPVYLTRLYASIDLGKTGAVTLFGDDGVIRASARGSAVGQTDLMGKRVLATPSDIQSSGIKARIGPADLDGVRRVTSLHVVNGFPMIVAVGLGSEEVLANIHVAGRLGFLIAICVSVFLAISIWAVLLHQRRHAVASARLRISERLYAEKSLILETALEHMNQGILMVDKDRHVQVCNRRAIELLGLTEELARKGTPFDDITRYQLDHDEFGLNGHGSENVLEYMRANGISDLPQAYERKRPTGTTLDICSMPIQGGGVVLTYTDMTARKATEEDLRTARDQANSAVKAKSEFLATMSHEIRSPLSGLVGALDMLRTMTMQPDQAHMVELAYGSARNLLAILNDILDFSKIEAGALTLSLEPVEIRNLVQEIAEPHSLVARGRSVVLTATVEPDVPCFIRTDRLRLGQIMTNLLSNAVKFTASGSIDLVARLEVVGGKTMLRIDVRDTGIGMGESTLARLFQPFTQADGSSSRMVEGTGLGLCISRKLARLLDGTLDVVSQLGIGSCFSLRVACIAHEVPDRLEPVVSQKTSEALLTGRRFLVVDDNPTNQWLTQRQLTLLGAETEIASNGQTALERLARANFDAVITDCHMPGFDGVALTRAIRDGQGPARDRPVIGLTADVTPEQATRCRNAGMDTILYKPVTQARLAQVLGSCTQARREAAAPPAIFDSTMCRDLFEPGDPESETWLREFCQWADQRFDELTQHMRTIPLDRPTIVTSAHQLVGASLSVGATRFAHALRSLEHAALTAPEFRLDELMDDIRRERATALHAIEEFIATEPALT